MNWIAKSWVLLALRDGAESTSAAAGTYGLKVMVVNESAGSGGDALPYYFQLRKIGPLVGTRTGVAW